MDVAEDMSMPVMDGLAATREIRKSERGAGVPIIAVTAHGREYRHRAVEAGCDGLLAKPVDFALLQNILDHYLDH